MSNNTDSRAEALLSSLILFVVSQPSITASLQSLHYTVIGSQNNLHWNVMWKRIGLW